MIMPPEPCIIEPAYSFNIDRFVEAWGEVQSGGDDFAVGEHGELGRFQIKKSLWEQHCHLPFTLARDRRNSEVVFTRIICDYLLKARMKGCTDSMLPAVVTQWLAVGSSHKGPINLAKKDEISRVLKLYELPL